MVRKLIFCWLVAVAGGGVLAGTAGADGEALVIFRAGLRPRRGIEVPGEQGVFVERSFGVLSKVRGREMALVRGQGRTTSELVARLARNPAVEHAEPNLRRFPLDAQPSDARFGELWGLGKVEAVAAWGLRRSADPVIVAVVDTGVSIRHPDLVPALWVNAGEIAGNGQDDDNNGYVDDRLGYDFVNQLGDPEPAGAHGTHVAGIAAGTVDNLIGIAGIARDARILGLKVADDREDLWTSAIIEAIEYTVALKQRGANVAVINASYGGDEFSTLEQEAIRAAGDVGIILCAAAGNSGGNLDVTPTYPASYRLPNMVVVAASDGADNLAGFSSYGAGTVDLAAPGVDILSTAVGLTGWVAQASSVIEGIPMEYSGRSAGLRGTLHDCGLGYAAEFPTAVAGNIALISRGTLTFAEKVANAMAAGARGAIIYNHSAGELQGTLGAPGDWIPVVGITEAAGAALKATGAINVEMAVVPAHDLYSYSSGTSMASPFVAGAVAFAAMQEPEEAVAERIRRVLDNVDKVPALAGRTVTGGRLNLRRIIDTDGDGLPDWWETLKLGSPAASPGADPDLDGMSTLDEYIADTHPANKQSVLRFTGIRPNGSGSTELRWIGGTAAWQFLEFARFPTGPWTRVWTNEPPTVLENSVTVDANSTGGFFRVRAERP